jgi:signal transduction histidine kinase
MRVLEAERQLRESSQLQAEENARMADQLRALDEMKNAILTAVSHELRTPLTVVLGLARTLHDREGVLSVPQRLDILRRLTASGEKLERLLSDLLDLDRLGRGIIEPRRVPTDVGDLVRRIVESSQMAGDRPVEFDGVSAMASIDAPKVERIIENLLVNAAKHTPPGSRVVVRVKAESGGIHIAVDDSGPGVPAHLREDIFQPFRQGPQQSPHSPGVGIGLSLVARFAELHGGRAWVEPRPGGGSSFRVFLADETNGSSSPPNPREPFGGEPIKAGGRRHRRTASGGM